MSEEKKEVEIPEVKQDIDIPENMEKYRDIIISIEGNFESIIASTADGFQGGDIMIFIMNIAQVIAKVKKTVEANKDLDGDDRLTVYNIIVASIVKRIIEKNPSLSQSDKDQILSYFGEDGVVLNFLDKIRDIYEGVLEKMDTNDDNKVSKQEFEDYVAKKCCNNRKYAKCMVSCCFPILSGGNDEIDIDTDEEEDENKVNE